MLVTAYRNGLTLGTPPPPRDHSDDALRATITGWTTGTVRRHTRWLYSVQPEGLTGRGIAFTLTLRECPEDSAAWTRVVRAFLARLERMEVIRLHWVVEWQRRGVPHLHGCVYFAADDEQPDDVLSPRLPLAARVVVAWLQAAGAYGPSFRSQDAGPISGALGWLQYLSKHAARGVAHYQRQGKPAGWEKTGRLWGHRGDWPTSEPMRFDVDRRGGLRLRRQIRAWRIADAQKALRRQLDHPVRDADEQARRVEQCRRRIRYARRMLRCSDPRQAAVRGASEWIGEAPAAELIWWLIREGHGVVQRVEVDDER